MRQRVQTIRSLGHLGYRRAFRVFAALLVWALPASAQTVPTGFQEYFVLGYEQHVWDMLTRVQVGEGGPAFANGMNSVVSATASADGQEITYDQWEDGLEADVTSPVQATTLVIGDANDANGRACDFTTDPRIAPCDGTDDDVLFAGSFVNFNSDQGLGCAAPPGDLNCSVPVNARVTSDVRYDGGDLIASSGGPLSLVHPQDPLSPFIGGATEIIPRQAVAGATAYTIPIGEDIYAGDNSVTEPFKYVEINLLAFDDNTQVNVSSPGAGNVSFTLNRGQHYSSQGWIDGAVAPAITINAGTRIATTGPIAGLIFTGGDGTFATRFYTLLPDILHSPDYIITAPGDDPALQGSRPLNLYIFNPDPLNVLTVTATDSAGTSLINVPPSSQVDYFTGAGRFVPTASTVRITSDRNFWGVSAYDHQSAANDWGHSWLARKFVTSTYTIPFAPGVNNPAFESQLPQRLANDPNCTIPPAGPGVCDPLNRSPIFVSATADNTRVQIDFDNDGTFDVIDLDGDDFPDPAPLAGNTYVINALQSLRVYDHNDYDNTGTLVVANRPVAVAYGEDTDQATGPDPIQDTGYAIYPINQLFLDPVLTIDKTVDTPVVSIAGGTVTYTLTLSAFDFGPIANLVAYDLLPPGIVGGDYVPGSTLVTYPDLTQDTSDPAASIDPGTGRDRLDWTLSPDSLQANQTLTVRYQVQVPPAPGSTPRLLTNEGRAEGGLGASTFRPVDTADVVQSDLVLNKSVLGDGTPEPGEVLTYTLSVANNGLAAETNAVITDAIPPNTTFQPGSVTSSGPFAGAFSAAQNAVVWTAASFPPGGPHLLTFQVVINPGVAGGTVISNSGTYESDQTPLFPSDQVDTAIVGPALLVAKSGPGLLHPNEVATFEVTVDNAGDGTATGVRIVDFFPANATYVAGSMEWRRNINPLTPVTDAADADEGTAFADRVELTVATLGPGEDLAFRFQMRVDSGTGGLFVNNQATVTSDELFPAATNLVQVPIVGDADLTGRVFLDLDGDGVQDPGEPGLADIDVRVTDSTGVTQIVTTDSNGDYLATVALACYEDGFGAVAYDGSDGSLDWSGAGDEWIEFSLAGLADQDPTTTPLSVAADPLMVFGDSLLISGGPAASTRGFTRQADLSAGAGFTSGFASLAFDYRRDSMEAADFVTLDVDYDNDGTFNDVLATFPGIGTDGAWQSAAFALDPAQLPDDPVVLRFDGTNFNFSNDSFYVDNVRLCNTQASADVDEADPDFPEFGAMLTTAPGCLTPPNPPCNDPQTVAVVPGGTVAAGPVGYDPRPLTFVKTSDALGGELVPGETVTYTIVAENFSGIDQTGVTVTDPLPAGMLAVPGSTQVTVTNPNFRVTEYFVADGSFPGTVYDLTLDQALVADYFAVVQGSDGAADGTGGGNRGPDENYAALTQDPFGTGGLGVSAGPAVLRLERGGAVDSWVGVVTVVECLADCADSGFTLLDVQRVLHAGAGTSGAVAAGTAWTDLGQVLLMGGFNGAGCDTAETAEASTKVCHARLFPSGTDQINWTRDAGGAALSAATSTVMVVEWGTEWTVQRARVQGAGGGDGADAVGEYNTAAISPVTRINTWVWGTGHTDDNGIGDAAEAVLVTLGDGVNRNVTESLVAAGIEYAANAVDFEVWALSHPDLAVDYRFKLDGDGGSETVDVAVTAATQNRMALAYNGQNGTGTAYPRPMFSARYVNDTAVRLERRRSGQAFPAWVQGIDFSRITGDTVFAGSDPPGLVTLADGVTLSSAGTLTVTFQLRVDPDLAPGITQIANVATLDTDQEVPENASVTDDVIRLDVTVEPNNAGFAVPGGSVTYTHVVTNTGLAADSYDLTLMSELGYTVELIDPTTGVVIATDSDGDGVWDGGVTVNTGSLAPGAFMEYRVRVHVPGGTPLGTEETTTLTAVSDRDGAGTSAFATDETTVVDTLDLGPVALVPDQSGVVLPGGSIVYTHAVINNTGATDTFDLTAFPALPGWTATFYADSNGDGVYTPGIDVAVMNTLQLTDGQLQTLFVRVDAPAGASAGDTDVVTLTAISRNDPALIDGATDTTTVISASTHDLSGGGTLLVDPGDVPAFPGTLKNITDSADRFDLTITPSLFFGLDGLLHPTQLWIDTNADGTPDTQIAEDTDGDGDWDTIAPGFDTDGDSEPDVAVAAGLELAYALQRPVDMAQLAYRDPITLTAISQATGEMDSVTATNLLAAATHAMLSRFEVRPTEGGPTGADAGGFVVEWRTSFEHGAAGFRLERRDGDSGAFRPLHSGLLPALRDGASPDGVLGGTYRFADAGAVPGTAATYRLTEVDVAGRESLLGWTTVRFDADRLAAPDKSAPVSGFSRRARLAGPARRAVVPAVAPPPALAAGEVPRLRLLVEESGLYFVDSASLAAAFGVEAGEVEGWIAASELILHAGRAGFAPSAPGPCPSGSPAAGEVFADGFESGDLCAWQPVVGEPPPGHAIPYLAAPDSAGIYFYGQAVDSIYTDTNVYWLERGPGAVMAEVAGGWPAPVPGLDFADSRHLEEEGPYPLTSVIEDPDSDFWFWNFVNVTPGIGISIDTMSVTIDVPDPAATGGEATMIVHLQAETRDDEVAPDHQAEVRLGGTLIGSGTWDGSTAHQLELSFPQALLTGGANTVEIHAPAASGIDSEIFYLDAIDLDYRRRYSADGDRLSAPAGGHGVLTFEGFTAAEVAVFEITDPAAPRLVTDTRIENAGGTYQVSFETASPGARYLALPLAEAFAAAIEVDSPSSLLDPGRRADYLVIAAVGLEAAAGDLAEDRQGQGLETLTVRLQDVYDEFSQGVVSPWAIRDFLAFTQAFWARAPGYVVLAGDSSFDFKDRLGLGGNLLPSPMTSTPEGLFPSDHRLADLAGEDGVPEVAVGRLPVRSDAELAAYVAKLQAAEAAAGAWKSRTTWVADAADEGGEFALDSDWLIERVPPALDVERIYVDDLGPAARQELLDTIDDGSLLIHFLGHANLMQLGDDAGLLLAADVAALANGERQPVLTAMTCALGRFDRIVFDTLSEQLLLHETGGVVALWAPTGFSFNEDGVLLSDGFLTPALGIGRLGDAVNEALAAYLADAEEPQAFVPFVYTLLGDPAIRLVP